MPTLHTVSAWQYSLNDNNNTYVFSSIDNLLDYIRSLNIHTYTSYSTHITVNGKDYTREDPIPDINDPHVRLAFKQQA